MLKKRSIATMMAAATVVTSVAPVFAAETEADVVERVSTIKTTLKKGQEETEQLIKDLRFLLNEGSKFEVVKNEKNERAYYSTTTDATVNGAVEIKKGDSVYAVFMNGVEVKSIVEVENAINSLKSSNGNIGSLELRVIDKGHALVDGKISAFNGRGEDLITTFINSKITIVASDANTTVLNVEDLYDGEYLTQKGFELYSAIREPKNLLNSEIIDTITLKSAYDKDGNEVDADFDREYGIKVEEAANTKEQTMKFELHVDYLDAAKEDEKHTIIIKGTDLAHTTELAAFLNETEGYDLGATRLAGEDRFKTAIKIAEERYGKVEKTTTATANIVLVNAESMIDGLTATPLAQVLQAPVLLTNKGAVQKDTLDYIKDVKKANDRATKVTIVGGDGVVSDAVVRELEKLGIKVERIGGEDRHATSVEVGIKMRSLMPDLTIDKAFVVAATGEADAMSIAPVAARETAPIIVEGFNGMTTTAKELLKNAKNSEDGFVDLIGGKVTEETQDFYAKSGDFVKGADRYDTNAKVVQKYYSEEGADAIYVAKDGMANSAQLVDALAVGTLAKENNAAIILATDGLSTRQKEAVKSVKKVNADDTSATTVKQIGGGVNFSTTVKAVAKILGFTK